MQSHTSVLSLSGFLKRCDFGNRILDCWLCILFWKRRRRLVQCLRNANNNIPFKKLKKFAFLRYDRHTGNAFIGTLGFVGRDMTVDNVQQRFHLWFFLFVVCALTSTISKIFSKHTHTKHNKHTKHTCTHSIQNG